MEFLKNEKKFCLSCMREHDVNLVQKEEQEVFKGEKVNFIATYEYCSDTDELLETEDLIRANSLAVKDAYRKKIGLLTAEEIREIREKYGLSLSDFARILNWGEKTITRYENFHVQDRAHDDILRKIDSDPKWLLDMLKRAREDLSQKAYKKYLGKIREQFNLSKKQYLIDVINAEYASLKTPVLTGCTELKLDKVVEVINYIADKVSSLHKVKLMKLLWYTDTYHYKKYGRAITGLAYKVQKMGAVPVGYDYIVNLDGVHYEVVQYDDIAYKFEVSPGFKVKHLSSNEMKSLDRIISELGDLNTFEIVEKMHEEEAYKDIPNKQLIPFNYAEKLSIN